jgi:glutathione-regulated potassium-efflux system ancillary protein KefG
MPRRILVQLAHPVLERSRVNRRLAAAVSKLDGVTLNDLYEVYPRMNIDVKREQKLLLEHDVVVFQHPFYWYSAPAMVKQWQDLVLEHGWAYGHSGKHLTGKITFNAITTGGPEVAYKEGGYNRFSIRTLLSPFDQTAHLCGMKFLAPFAVHAAMRIETDADAEPHAKDYLAVLEALRDDRFNVEEAAKLERMNTHLSTLVRALS